MTVIRPNSISGVSSITGSGGDISIFRADGTAADVTVNNITSGIVTATTFSGAVTGAVTGNVTGNVTGTSSGLSGNPSINTTGIVTATSFVPTTGQLSHRNIVVNGAMTVSQRGTSETGITGAKFANAPDRFKIEGGSYGTITVSQSTDSPNGFANSYKVDVTTANGSLSSGSYLELVHKLEGQDVQSFAKGTSDAKQFALSFHVKTTKTGTYVVLVIDHDNSRMVSKTYTVSDTNWNKYELIFPADTTGAFGNDNNLSLSIKFVLVAGTTFTSSSLQTTWGAVSNGPSRTGQVNFADSTSNDWYLTGVQLEVGPVVTPFEHRSRGDELQRCRRYYQVLVDQADSGSEKSFAIACAYSSTSMHSTHLLSPEMRTVPTLDYTTGSSYYRAFNNGTSDYFDEFTLVGNSHINAVDLMVSSALSVTQGAAVLIRTSNNASRIAFTAEL